MSSSAAMGDVNSRLDSIFHGLAHESRRAVLATLRKQPSYSMINPDMITLLGRPPGESRGPRFNQWSELSNQHLPTLEAAGMIAFERTTKTVQLIEEHPAFADSGITEVLDNLEHHDDKHLNDLFDALSAGRRREILDILSHQFGPIHLETLAGEIVAEDGQPPSTVSVQIELYHVHLPKLANAGLIEYDATEHLVEYTGHPVLRVAWTHSCLAPHLRDALSDDSEPPDSTEIQGRERVISWGQSRIEQAESEIYVMLNGTDLLETGCRMRVKDAVDRGVDLYVGTHDPTVIEFLEEHVSEAHIWQPSANWMEVPIAGHRIGRLLLVDREHVMIGSITDAGDATYAEEAIIADGEENPLVTLVSQLVQPQIGVLEQQGESTSINLTENSF